VPVVFTNKRGKDLKSSYGSWSRVLFPLPLGPIRPTEFPCSRQIEGMFNENMYHELIRIIEKGPYGWKSIVIRSRIVQKAQSYVVKNPFLTTVIQLHFLRWMKRAQSLDAAVCPFWTSEMFHLITMDL
jgi:hypothetical protein